MVSYGGGHVNIIKSIYHELRKERNVDLIYLALTSAPLQLQGTDINYITASDILEWLPYRDEVEKLGKLYGAPFHNYQLGVSLEDTVAYYGIGIYDLIQKYGTTIAKKRFEEDGRKAFLPIGTMENILQCINPDCCVITASPRMEMATGIAADKLNIPVVRVNDLPICNELEHDCILCVMNEWAKTYAIQKAGVPEKKIRVTGQPIFEENEKINNNWITEFKESAVKYNYTVVFFAENGKNQTEEIDAIYEIAEQMKNVLFIIKLHPNQQMESFQKSNQKNVWVKKEPAKNYLQVAHLVITTFSTTGMEAAIKGIPLIEIKFKRERYPIEYIEMGIACLAENKSQLFNEIRLLLDKSSDEYKELMFSSKAFDFVSNASANICSVIKEQC